jgi:hypothetical protein
MDSKERAGDLKKELADSRDALTSEEVLKTEPSGV